ncbi:hypothetical protein Q5762_31590 [Streptomyces sp. P9(2023)]|uniref:hypothetical protein n=1 Tax=Streptomyces sp. P9(2023) TaxID=3064394 RepID=UPI0028F432C6|nr:hypothetical protein [Streptomyces sp. P9(2023)]MDT9692787.1 hypothetical protein [Streptomyces sp. P9(2023)]
MGERPVLVVVVVVVVVFEEPRFGEALEPGTKFGLAVLLAEDSTSDLRDEVVDADVVNEEREPLA